MVETDTGKRAAQQATDRNLARSAPHPRTQSDVVIETRLLVPDSIATVAISLVRSIERRTDEADQRSDSN